MVKAVADSDSDSAGGYASDAGNIIGFSQLHDSGTGGVRAPVIKDAILLKLLIRKKYIYIYIMLLGQFTRKLSYLAASELHRRRHNELPVQLQ